MRFIGIDIAAEKHVVAIVDEAGGVLVKSSSFTEDLGGYEKLFGLVGSPEEALVVMEATGHYWQNLFATLVGSGFSVAVLNPLRVRRFADVDLPRAKTDAIDAVAIARFGQEKRPAPTKLPDEATLELREMVRLRDRYVQDLGDRVRQLHRAVDLTFPELTSHIKTLDSELATAVLKACPTAAQMAKRSVHSLAELKYDKRHVVGDELANALVAAAKKTVGKHQSAVYSTQITQACEDIDTLRGRIRALDRDLGDTVRRHDVASLLTTIDGIGDNTAARLVAEFGDFSQFADGGAVAAFVGVVPIVSQSGKRQPQRAATGAHGDAKLRAKLWMPTLTAIQRNPWLRAFYERLIARGKLPKVAITAAMRKLVMAIVSVVKHRRPFTPMLPAAPAMP